MNKDRCRVNHNKKPIIKRSITQKEYHNFEIKEIEKGMMHSSSWFYDASKWYQIHTYNNPYNIGSPNSELELMFRNRGWLSATLEDCSVIIFWGVGNADTEMVLVDYYLKSARGKINIIAIDINKTFLNDFYNALVDKLKENPSYEIYYFGINSLFEFVSHVDINAFSSGKKFLVCVGNTIGNYQKTEDILRIFKHQCNKCDLLLVGFQTDNEIEVIFSKYAQNRYLEDLFIPALKRMYNYKNIARSKINWKLNAKRNQIEAWYNNIQLFRSKKQSPTKMKQLMAVSGFMHLGQAKDDFSTCIQLYKLQ